ncbi:hypothetical protein B0H65DRAFT_592942 [Neurospora tetraspora]|uniref:YWTD domain-containing protein n=1 Tax=Neurospora tetraspora TaxID=94610 RepID=A0AAE0J0N8_9PEZI|nr:hypothetical protein B0H65DRAFT_592942 [Neurospora tetraspora]
MAEKSLLPTEKSRTLSRSTQPMTSRRNMPRKNLPIATRREPSRKPVAGLDPMILRLDEPNQPPKALVTAPLPDDIDVDPSANRVYWTNMGADVTAKDGSLMSSTLDGFDKKVLLADGILTTPKQLVLVKDQQTGTEKLYFCDREGCSVHRCNVDSRLR